MKIVLQQPVDKLGVPGDIVVVADGYARNYLVPRRLAAPFSKGAVKHAERLRAAHDQRTTKELQEAREVAERVSSAPVRISVRAGQDGKLFGSITAADVAKELEKGTGLAVDRRQLHLPEPIRSVGSHEATLHLHPEVDARVAVEVLPA